MPKPNQPKSRARVRAKPSPVAATAPADLVKIRARIDDVDQRIPALISERARLAQHVGVTKRASGAAVEFYRPEREAEVLQLVIARNEGPLTDEEMVRLFREIMS
ncbi:MAG: chorismate mutase, partial [Pseudomonadota bacterium]